MEYVRVNQTGEAKVDQLLLLQVYQSADEDTDRC